MVETVIDRLAGPRMASPGRLDSLTREHPNGRNRRTSADRFWSRFGPELPHYRHWSETPHGRCAEPFGDDHHCRWPLRYLIGSPRLRKTVSCVPTKCVFTLSMIGGLTGTSACHKNQPSVNADNPCRDGNLRQAEAYRVATQTTKLRRLHFETDQK